METKQTTQKKNKYYKTLKLVFGLKITTRHRTVTKVETQKFQHGSSEVPAKVQERSRKFPRKVPRKVPARFQHRFQEGSKRFQEGSSTVPAIFQQRSSKVPARLQARFQGCSGFSGRAFSRHHSPPPEIETQQIRCWGLIHTSIVMVLALFLLQAFTISTLYLKPFGTWRKDSVLHAGFQVNLHVIFWTPREKQKSLLSQARDIEEELLDPHLQRV